MKNEKELGNWFICNLYHECKDIQNNLNELNEIRLKVENQLKNFIQNYEWFTLIYGPNRVKFGTKAENEEKITGMVADLKKEYPDLICGNENEYNYNLEIIATQCRLKLEENNAEQKALIFHLILNPLGYDSECKIHLRNLEMIEEKLVDWDLKVAINVMKGYLLLRNK